MSNYENNPFSGKSESPFADPSVTTMTTSAARRLEDFNPFADQNVAKDPSKEKQTTLVPPPPEAALPYVVKEEHENLGRRQEELERVAAELQRKEQELQRMQFGGYRENNFPPLPSSCPCKPCFFHDIRIDIPIEYQKTCKFLFFRWKAYSFVLFLNFLSAFALLVDNDDEYLGGRTFGLSLLYLVANVPLSFLFWYRPAYNALKNDSSFSYIVFFVIFFLHIGINIFYAFGVPGYGACGFINATTVIHNSYPVGGMMFASAILFTVGVITDIAFMIKINRIYRVAGASFVKAQGEFTRGVASNQHVQNAAAAGFHTAVANQN